MTDEEDELRALLAEPWAPGQAGKALLFVDGAMLTWRTVTGGAPHHTGAQHLLGIPTEALAAYIVIESDGAVESWARAGLANAEQLVEQALAADGRLYRAPPRGQWGFGDADAPGRGDADEPRPGETGSMPAGP